MEICLFIIRMTGVEFKREFGENRRYKKEQILQKYK
jgi:hypothetical protein